MEYEYDDRGRITSARSHDGGDDESVDWTNSRTYGCGTDDAGDWMRCYPYSQDASQADRYHESRLDANGNVVSSQHYELQEDGTWAPSDDVVTFEYEETVEYWTDTETPKTRTSAKTSSDPTLSESTVTTYDEEGRPTSSMRTFGDSTSVGYAEYKGTVPEGFLDDELSSPDVVLRSCGVTERR